MEQISASFIASVKENIEQKQKIVILSHKNPDGDAMGSGLALYNYLTQKGKQATFISPNALPQYLSWMPGCDEIISYEGNKEQSDIILKEAELIFMVDFNHTSRISAVNDVVSKLTVTKVMIDHHPYPQDVADYLYSRVSSSSTAEMVYELLSGLENTECLDNTVSTCLMVGIITDTGTFRYNSSNPLTFKAVSGLMQAGVNKDFIIDKIYNNYSEYRLRLLGFTMKDKMVVLPEFQTAYIYLSKKDLETFKFEQGDTEGFVNYPLSIRGINFSAIFIEKDDMTKCSFRSQGTFPANLVSEKHFNGGGHLNAAGGESKLSLMETVAKFEKILPEFNSYLDA